jgi:hypothetical protein
LRGGKARRSLRSRCGAVHTDGGCSPWGSPVPTSSNCAVGLRSGVSSCPEDRLITFVAKSTHSEMVLFRSLSDLAGADTDQNQEDVFEKLASQNSAMVVEPSSRSCRKERCRLGRCNKSAPTFSLRQCDSIYGTRRFARALRYDIEAVRNAVQEPWSNDQTAGQINRLKTLKRTMCGRAGVDLLRARFELASARQQPARATVTLSGRR